MKILWIVNIIFPEVADELKIPRGFSGGWLLDLAEGISKNDEFDLAIASVYNGTEMCTYHIGNKTFFLIPGGGKKKMFYSKSNAVYWKKIEEQFMPDIVHLHGTEYTHGLVYMDTFPDKKYLLTIQGIIGAISREFNANLTFRQKLKYRTLREWLHFNGMFEKQALFFRNVKYEKRIIEGVKYVTGRTFWDEAIIRSINPEVKYYRCFYNLRKEFYSADKWKVDAVERFTIYGSTAAQAPLKGGHVVLKAISIVKYYYPQVKIRFLMPNLKDGRLPINSGYQKMIAELIEKYDIKDNVEFIPSQRPDGVIYYMQRSHCAIIPSAMENASSTLREAMHIGVPCIASYRGGMTDLIKDGEDGYFFDFEESEFLAQRIVNIFSDDELAKKLSQNAIIKAEKWHDRDKNITDMECIYRMIMEG
jgi:glycosyltransferase involved in cell wall biosynthesis